MDIEAKLREFLDKRLLRKQGSGNLSTDESLLDSGLLDSMAIFELVSFVESQFGVKVSVM